jgi:hypothetical protein
MLLLYFALLLLKESISGKQRIAALEMKNDVLREANYGNDLLYCRGPCYIVPVFLRINLPYNLSR